MTGFPDPERIELAATTGRPVSAADDYFSTLVETVNEGFMAVDAGGIILLFNRRLEQITGSPEPISPSPF